MKTVKAVIILTAFLFLASSVVAAQPIAFTDVTVIDVRDGVARPDMTVVVSGNRIAAVEPANTMEIPSDATIIDGTGRFLIPGLWDMHVHTVWHDYGGLPHDLDAHFPLFMANGVTGVRDTWGNAAAAQELRREIATGRRVGPRLVVAGNLLDGPQITWPGSTSVTSPERGRFVVDSLAATGADFVKVYMSLSPEVYHAIVDRAREVGLPVAGHVPPSVPAREASEAGQRSMEHLVPFQLDCSSREEELRGKGPLDLLLMRELLDSYDPAMCLELFRTFAKNGTWQVPTLVVFKRWPVLDSETFLPGEGHWYMPPVQHTAWAEQMEEAPTIPEDWRELSEEERRLVRRFWFDHKLEMVRLMSEVGVPILAGSDVNGDGRPPFLSAGFSLHEELELLVEAGLTPTRALRAATLEPARYLDATDSLGTVEAGKLADLVLLDANPLEDIRNTRLIRAVVANGRHFKKEDILSLREQVLFENYRKALDVMVAQVETAATVSRDIEREAMTDTLLSLTGDFATSWAQRKQDDYLGRFSDDLIFHFQGFSLSRSEYEHIVRDSMSSWRESTFEVLNPEVIILGPGAAVATFDLHKVIVDVSGTTMDLGGTLTLIYQRRGGEWLVIRAHESHRPSQ